MIFSLMLSSLINLSAVDADSCKQLDCEDASRFSEEALGTLSRLSDGLKGMRELSLQAANGAIGNRERGFLDSEYEARLAEIQRILRHRRFTDIFQDQHYYLRDGFKFKTPIRIEEGDFAYLQDFEFTALTEGKLGSITRRSLPLQYPEGFEFGLPYKLKINDVLIKPSNSDDAVSSWPGQLFSAITLAAAINKQSGLTGVWADVEENIVTFEDMDHGLVSDIQSLERGDLKVNNVQIRGQAGSVSELVNTLSDMSNSTGISAWEHEGKLQLVAHDGRNIVVNTSSKLREALGLESKLQVFNGSIELMSQDTISMSLEEGFPILEGLDSPEGATIIYPVVSSTGLVYSDISTQEHAQDSLAILDAALSQVNDRMVEARLPGMLCE